MSETEAREVELGESDLAHRRNLEECEGKASDAYDRTLLWLCGGALALSLGFTKDVVPNPDPASLWVLGLAWAGLSLALFCALTAQMTSMKSMRFEIECVDGKRKKRKGQKSGGKWRTATDVINWMSMVACGLGVGLLAIYAYWNLQAAH